MMEEIREEKIAQILGWLQAVVRGHMSRVTYHKLKAQKVRRNFESLLLTCDFNLRGFF